MAVQGIQKINEGRESIEPSVMVGTCAVCVSKVELGGLISSQFFYHSDAHTPS